MNPCDAVRELLAADALKALDAGQGALLREHLSGCADCRAAEVESRAAVALIAAPPVAPPRHLWLQLRGRLERELAGDAPIRDVDPGAVIAVSCSFCRGGLVRAQTVYCASCLAPHHQDCFAEHGRCSVMGCAETQVVRPEGLRTAAPARTPAVAAGKPGEAPGHRWRWLAGGLLGLATGGAVAALALRPPAVAPPPPVVAATPSPVAPAVLSPPRLDVEAEEATVGELCERLEAVTGVKLHLDPQARQRALPGREWWDTDWKDVLSAVAADAGLELVLGGEGGAAPWALLAPPRGDPRGDAPPPARTWVSGVHLFQELGGGWDQTGLTELPGAMGPAAAPPARVRISPRGELLTVVGERGLRLFRGRKALGGLRLSEPVRDAAWAPDGGSLLLLTGAMDSPLAALLLVDVAGRAGPVPVERFALPEQAGVHWRRVVPTGDGWALVEGSGRALMVAASPRVADAARFVALPGKFLDAVAHPLGALLADERAVWLAQPGGAPPVRILDESGLLPATAPLLGLRPTPDGRHVLVQEEARARVLTLPDATQARFAGPVIARIPEGWPWAGALSPDGRSLAWIDGRTFFLRGPGQSEAEIPALDLLGEEPLGLAWRPDGAAVAVWSQGGVCLVEPAPGRSRTALIHELPDGPGGVEDVQWLDARQLVVVTSAQRARAPRVSVLPSRGGELPWASPERELRGPAPLPGAGRLPAPPEEEVREEREEESQEGDRAPKSPAEPAGRVAEPLPEPAPRVDLSHVRAGQRWVFRVPQTRLAELLEEWTVLEVARDRVRFERRVYLGGKRLEDVETHVWTPDQLLTAEVRDSGAAPQRRLERLQAGSLSLDAWVDRHEGVELWRAAGTDPERRYTFPGLVRDVRGGQVRRELLRVEE